MLSKVNDYYQSTQNAVNRMTAEQKTKLKIVGAALVSSYFLYKIHSIGCWKYKQQNPSVPILFYQPFMGTIQWANNNKSDRFHQKLTAECLRLIKQTGEKFVMFGGPGMPASESNYMIFCPKIIKLIYEDQFTGFIKGRGLTEVMEPLLGHGIVAVNGKEWKFQRKVGSRMFGLNNLKNYMFQCSADNANVLLAKMEQLSLFPTTRIMDMWEMFGRFTLQSFMQSAFGEKADCIELLPKQHSFCTAFDCLATECMDRLYDPLWRVRRFFKIGKRESCDIPKHSKILDEFAYEVIKKRMNSDLNKNILNEDREKHDLLSLFMKYNKEEKKSQLKNVKDIKDFIMNFVIAARDTTRVLLSWFFYEVTKPENKDILNKLYAEIDQYSAEKLLYNDCRPNTKKVDGKDYDKTVVDKYKYLESALMETLRIHPPVPFLERVVVKHTVIPYTDYNGNNKVLKLSPNDAVTVYNPAYLRLPQLWGPNANAFVPSRFANGLNSYDMYKFPAFNLNPRLCLGRTAAMMQAKVMAILILRKYEIIPEPNQNVVSSLAPILAMERSNGFKVKIKPRK